MISADSDVPDVPKCQQCGGSVFLCETMGSTCRLKNIAREWWNHRDYHETPEETVRALARLLRVVEDGSWERLSVARTKENERLRIIETAARALVNEYGAEPERPCAQHPACGYIGCDMKARPAKAWDELKAALLHGQDSPDGNDRSKGNPST